MRIKDSHKGNAEGGGKKESKKKSGRQKAEASGAVTANKTEKNNITRTVKETKQAREKSLRKKEEPEQQV